MSTDTDPASVMAAITADCKALDSTGAELGRKIKEQAKADSEYNRAVQIELIKIHDEAKTSGSRPPAEDLRKAIAHAAVLKSDPDVWMKYLTTSAEVEALKAWIGAKRATVSARQSILSALKDEMRAAA